MKVNAEKCVSISQVWPNSLARPAAAETDLNPSYIHTDTGDEEIRMEMVSIYLVWGGSLLPIMMSRGSS
jgi:hypothetical protein